MQPWFNEIDPFAAQWLRNLFPEATVNETSIVNLRASDIVGHRCHFFGGIGGWELALQLAGWPAEREVWTGSCPCQPWSEANHWEGGGKGAADPRHLWPAWLPLIRERRPSVVFGEQVLGAVRRGWLDEVFGDLEAEGYACGAIVCAAKDFGAIHERKRIFWVADAGGARWERHQQNARLSVAAQTAQPVNGDTLVRARRAVDGDLSDLLLSDGLSVQVERHAVKGYGNAIVPQVAATFIQAFLESESHP